MGKGGRTIAAPLPSLNSILNHPLQVSSSHFDETTTASLTSLPYTIHLVHSEAKWPDC